MGTAMGVAVGTAVVPCTAGAYSLWRGDGSQLLALWGTRTGTFPLGTLPLLGVFWGRQDPHTPHGLPGGWGGDTKIDEQQRWRSRQGGQNWGGRWWAGVCLSPDPSAHSQGLTRTQGAPVPEIPGDRSTTALTSPTCKGAAQPVVQGGYEPHGHPMAMSSCAQGPRHPLALALRVPELVQAIAAQEPGEPGAVAPALVARLGQMTGTAPHPVY